MNIKRFKDIKPGDTIYIVMKSQGKTKIFKKIVSSKVDRSEAESSICIRKGLWGVTYYGILKNKTFCKAEWTDTYLCTNLEDAKSICFKLTEDIISKTKEELKVLQDRLDRWHNHLADLSLDKFTIK